MNQTKSFTVWMRELNAYVSDRLMGMDTGDLCDMHYRGMFDDECTIEDAWQIMLEENEDLQGFEGV